MCFSVVNMNQFQKSYAFLRAFANYEMLILAASVRMEQFGFHWTDFHESLYLSIVLKPVEKIQFSLKLDNDC